VVSDEGRPWTDVFTSTETYVDAQLAALYGMTPPAAGYAWQSYGTSPETKDRRGILSHGSFLSVAGKFGDTSPTQRGKLIRERLLCQVVPPPPPDVDVDQPPTSPTSSCKYDRYEAHRSVGSCAGCHNQIDPVGFGLEAYDQSGRWRAHDNGEPTCTIAGDGFLLGVNDDGTPLPFNGPGELGDLLVSTGLAETCLITQVYRFAMGHREAEDDFPMIDALAAAFAQHRRLDELVLGLVSAEAFGYRQEED
jgi:hypothetical protein